MKKRLSVLVVLAMALTMTSCKDTANSVDSTTLDTSSSQSVSEPVESKPQSKSVPPVSSSSMPIASEPTKEEPKSEVTAPSSKPSTTGGTTITPPKKETPPVVAPAPQPTPPPVVAPAPPPPPPAPQCQHQNGTVCPVCGLDLTGYVDMSGLENAGNNLTDYWS